MKSSNLTMNVLISEVGTFASSSIRSSVHLQGYPSCEAGLITPWLSFECNQFSNTTGNFTMQASAFDALLSTVVEFPFVSGVNIFWFDNPTSSDWIGNRENNNWSCGWTPRLKPAECTIANAFGGVCSSSSLDFINS
jgi:hypothetical protein